MRILNFKSLPNLNIDCTLVIARFVLINKINTQNIEYN